MLSYLNNTKLKRDFVKEIKWHQDQDKTIKGTYQEGTNGDFKGCAVGCSIHSLNRLNGTKFETSKHKVYETALGIPEWLARLEDDIFEGLPTEEALKWPLRFSKAIPVGVDLEPVKWQFCAYLMKENIDRVLKLDISDELKEQVVSAIRGVLSLHEEAIKTGRWDGPAAWSAAESAAESAAWSAAESARSAARSARPAAWSAAESAAWSARPAAWSAAEAATESARSSARSSAWSAARSAAWSAWSARSAARSARPAAWSAAYVKHSKELLKLLKASNSKQGKE